MKNEKKQITQPFCKTSLLLYAALPEVASDPMRYEFSSIRLRSGLSFVPDF